MPYKDPAVQRAYQQRYHREHREERRAYSRAHPERMREGYRRQRQARRAEDARLKLAAGCVRCGYRENAAALEWHHRDPATKIYNISGHFTWRGIDEERAKCDVLCANCHAILHYDLESN